MRYYFRFTVLLLCVAAGLWAGVYFLGHRPSSVCWDDACVQVEVVSKERDMERGLQGRQGLAKDKGMLFVFAQDGRHRFWMKDMNFSLDMIWLDSSGSVVTIARKLPPCRVANCPVYEPSGLARYVLEVDAGYALSHGLDQADLTRININ